MNGLQQNNVDADKINKEISLSLDINKKPQDSNTGDDKDKDKSASSTNNNSKIGIIGDGGRMTFSKMLEAMTAIVESINDPVPETTIEDEPVEASQSAINADSETELLDHLNQIFTPILVMQGFEGDIADKIQEAFSEASVLMERNIISFDDKARMAQLISVCSLLIAQHKKQPKFDMYAKAAAVRNQMKLEIQKDNYDEARALAQKFLVKVSTTNNSTFARDAAQDLLPETQH